MKQVLKPGDQAPAFQLPDAEDHQTALGDFRGQWVVLYFYPKDNTPGCTLEALDFSAKKQEFSDEGAIILGVSKDSCQSHRKFVAKQHLTIILLSDAENAVQKTYGVWRPKKFMGREFLGTIRSTFLIDPQGEIRKIWDNVSAKGHAEEVLAILRALKSA